MRARNLKPGLFKNEELGTADPLYTLIFEGLWTLADREGRLQDRPLRIHAEINPYRPGTSTAEALDWLTNRGFIIRYRVNGAGYIWIPTFLDHQHPHMNETPSKLPPLEKADTDQGDRETQVLHGATLVQIPEEDQRTRASSLIPSSLIPSNSPSERYVELQPTRPGPVDRIFEYWKATWNHPRAKLDSKRRRLIAQALKTYTESDLRTCIGGYLNSSHHCGENDRRAVYDDIGLFLRDAAHIDAGIAFGQGRPNGAAQPELIFRREEEFRAYEAATKQGMIFTDQAEWEAHYGRQTH